MTTRAEFLENYLREARGNPFCWQSNNCAHFTARWVERAERRELPIPSTLRESIRLRNEKGSVVFAVSWALGRDPIESPRLAAVGDVVLLPSKRPERVYLGICCGRSAAFLPKSTGELAFVRSDVVTAAWRVEWAA